MKNELKESERFNGKCKHCGKKASFLAESRVYCEVSEARNKFGITSNYIFTNANGKEMCSYSNDTSTIVLLHDCPGRDNKPTYIFLQKVLGKVVKDKLCDGRCLAATGNCCECACGGKNHGAGHNC